MKQKLINQMMYGLISSIIFNAFIFVINETIVYRMAMQETTRESFWTNLYIVQKLFQNGFNTINEDLILVQKILASYNAMLILFWSIITPILEKLDPRLSLAKLIIIGLSLVLMLITIVLIILFLWDYDNNIDIRNIPDGVSRLSWQISLLLIVLYMFLNIQSTEALQNTMRSDDQILDNDSE